MERQQTNLREILTMEEDIDFYDTILDNEPIAFCGPLKLRPAGEARYGEILNLPIILITRDEYSYSHIPNYSWAYLDTDELERRSFTEKQIRRTMHCLFSFLWAAAGYIDNEEWDRLFIFEEDEEMDKFREMEDNTYENN